LVSGLFAFLTVTTMILCAPALALAVAKPLGSRVLRQGMTGSDVRSLQSDLTQAGFKTPPIGIFGPITERSVTSFERRYGLGVNGIVNSSFVRALKTVLAADLTDSDVVSGSGGIGVGVVTPAPAPAPAPATKSASAPAAADPTSVTDPITAPVVQDGGSQHLGERTLQEGMEGHDVRVLQGFLTIAGYTTAVTGDFDATTDTNVIAFQQANSLTANGIVTYADSVVLRQLVAKALAGGPVATATINADGTATAPSTAPAIVQDVIAAANQIIDKPYIFGGGHASFNDIGYDCSGSVSYALHGGNLLSAPEDSTELESYGSEGPGQWITIYADSTHTWIVVAGIAFDTADFGGPNIPIGTGPRWRSDPTGNLADGGDYIIRHPSGL
jgi:peptidoglycan hydrolase-like protein with peptidoglycan-binding domain